MENDLILRLKNEINNALENKALKKAVLSRPRDKSVMKQVMTVIEKDGAVCFKLETFTRDEKSLQLILPLSDGVLHLTNVAVTDFKQINLIASDKTMEVIISDKGKFHVTGSLIGAAETNISTSQDRKKSYIITPETDGDFLYALGITDRSGRIHDKKQANTARSTNSSSRSRL